MSNSGWDLKKKALSEHGAFTLNRKLCALDTWDDAAIKDRASKLFMLATSVWPRPVGDPSITTLVSVLCTPSDGNRTVEADTSKAEVATLTTSKQLQLAFWSEFRKFAQEHAQRIKATKPRPQHWMTISLGRSGFHLSAVPHYGMRWLRLTTVMNCGPRS